MRSTLYYKLESGSPIQVPIMQYDALHPLAALFLALLGHGRQHVGVGVVGELAHLVVPAHVLHCFR